MHESTVTNNADHNVDKPLNSKGRFGRLSYLAWILVTALVFYVIAGIAVFLFIAGTDSAELAAGSYSVMTITSGILLVIAYIGLLYCNVVLTIRRLHDINQSGWLSLLMIIPVINLIFLLYVSIAQGTHGRNNYGLPRLTRGWEKVMGWIYIVLVPIGLIGILAAITIPAYQDYIERAKSAEQSGYSQSINEPVYNSPASAPDTGHSGQ